MSARHVFALAMFVTAVVSWPVFAAEEEGGDDGADSQEPVLTVDEILNRDPTQDDYSDEPRCLRTGQIRSTEVLDDKHVVIQISRDRYYLIQMKYRCPGLERGRTIYLDTNANRLCELDSIRGSFPEGFGVARPGPRCSIPGFQSITKEQVVLLKDALRAERRKKRNS